MLLSVNGPSGDIPVRQPGLLTVFSRRFRHSSPRCRWRPARNCRRSRGTGRARSRRRTCLQCLIGSLEIHFGGTTRRARGRVDGHLGAAFRAFPELSLKTWWSEAHIQLTPLFFALATSCRAKPLWSGRSARRQLLTKRSMLRRHGGFNNLDLNHLLHPFQLEVIRGQRL